MPRRFITAHDIDELADRGATELPVDDATTVTDVARERARERGLTIVHTDPARGTPAPPGGAVPAVPAADRGRVRAEVRAAVIARLGLEPPQLERIIDRVLDGGG
jgi:hypothetical protein